MSDAFGVDGSQDAILIFEYFALVFGLTVIGIITVIFGTLSFNNLDTLKRLSFIFFAIAGFIPLHDLINVFKGHPTAPLPVIIVLGTMGLFYYGSKKGTF